LFDRIVELGVIPVPQQRFIHELGDGFIANLGRDRVRLTYPQRTLIDRGVLFPGSSDRPVVDGAPLLGIQAAVNQRTASGRPYVPEERITVEEALCAYTLHSAYCSFEEHIKGSLEPGKLADFVVLDRDLTSVPSDELSDIQIVATAVGGKFRFGRGVFQ
jgi:predicted amidohydrolase YtcJ